jgi:hypothetical protein
MPKGGILAAGIEAAETGGADDDARAGAVDAGDDAVAVPDADGGVVEPDGVEAGVAVPAGLPVYPPAGLAGLLNPPSVPPEPDEDEGFEYPGEPPPDFPAANAAPTFDAIPLNTNMVNNPGIRERPIASPENAGLRPTLLMISSSFRPHFVMATIIMSHGMTAGPEGIFIMADNMSFRHTILITIIKHILPNILDQPLKISNVLLLPPIANASGERITKSTVTTYRSPIWKKILII